jgi:hypothetical protein
MKDLIKNEPVLVSGLVLAFISLLIAFGIHLSNEQVGAIMAFLAAALAFVTRAFVTPVAKNDAPADTP